MEGRCKGDEGRDLVIWICLVLDYVVIYLFGFVIFWVWICNDLDLVMWLFVCLWICIFFNKYFGFIFRFVNFVPKGKSFKNYYFFCFEKIKICTKGPKPV
jgi:hypothetical protein